MFPTWGAIICEETQHKMLFGHLLFSWKSSHVNNIYFSYFYSCAVKLFDIFKARTPANCCTRYTIFISSCVTYSCLFKRQSTIFVTEFFLLLSGPFCLSWPQFIPHFQPLSMYVILLVISIKKNIITRTVKYRVTSAVSMEEYERQ